MGGGGGSLVNYPFAKFPGTYKEKDPGKLLSRDEDSKQHEKVTAYV
jgi:hypothetical protein